MTWFGIKWPERGWYAVKQNNQTKLNMIIRIFPLTLGFYFKCFVANDTHKNNNINLFIFH